MKTRLYRIIVSGLLAVVFVAGFAPVVFARIMNPSSAGAGSGITSIGPAGQTQSGSSIAIATSTSGTDISIVGAADVLTFNFPTASGSNRGLLSAADWTTFNGKESALTFTYPLSRSANTISTGFGTTTANVFSALNTFANASSTLFSVTSRLYAGATATTTIESNGRINAEGASTTPQRSIVYKSAAAVECSLTDAATVTWDVSTCSQARVTLGGNRTLDITNAEQAMGQALRLVVCQSAGSNTLASDAIMLWQGGTAPTLTTTANKCDVFAGFTTLATGTARVLMGSSLNF